MLRFKEIINPIFSEIVKQKSKHESDLLWNGAAKNHKYYETLISESNNRNIYIDENKNVVFPLILRGKAWSTNDLIVELNGDNPLESISNRVSNYRIRREQALLMSILNGVFDNKQMFKSGYIYDTSEQSFNVDMLYGPVKCLKELWEELVAIVVSPQMYAKLQKENAINYLDNKYPFWNNCKIIIDESIYKCNRNTEIYYLCKDSFIRAEGCPHMFAPSETDYDRLSGLDILITRWAMILHPFGMSWTGKSAGVTPTNEELKNPNNWKLVEPIRMAMLKCNI